MADRRAGVAGFVLAAGVLLTALGLVPDRPAAGQQLAPAATPAPVQPAAGAPASASPNSAASYYFYTPPQVLNFAGEQPAGEELRQLQQQTQQLDNEVNKLLADYAAAADDAKPEVKTRLQESLRKQFEARQQERNHEITELEAQVKRLRDLHQKREAAKEEIVGSRLSQLVRSAEGLGWDAGEASGLRATAVRAYRADPVPVRTTAPAAR